eukprot:CAMPEP_0172424098 /NCGR_PEP_ID=MMETSP1064-20121228/21237_1 /TAXON_ID=202472 /ORGANISM="Aulacoseira subarctica , Strain CCAP 1002/5" /LENGTH=276 /DNA_ID=CAMNT_0013165855 /DNA_START=22 /DNA_END=852 /DNA_ORIENTATION=+
MDIDEEDQEALVKCGTTKGPFTIRLVRKWSPLGYDRAVSLFQRGFYDHSHFFRTVHGFLVQFGISYTDEDDLLELADKTIRDDPQLDPPIPFEEGIVSYAGGGKDSRTSQLFIAYDAIDSFGQELWETPIGKVIQGMENVKKFYGDYGDMPPWGEGPEQWRIEEEGEEYMEENYPLMDKFKTCKVKVVYPGNRELLSVDAKDSLTDFAIPRAVGLGTEENGNYIRTVVSTKGASGASGILKLSSDSMTLIGMIGITFVIVMICFFRRKEKEAGKKN